MKNPIAEKLTERNIVNHIAGYYVQSLISETDIEFLIQWYLITPLRN